MTIRGEEDEGHRLVMRSSRWSDTNTTTEWTDGWGQRSRKRDHNCSGPARLLVFWKNEWMTGADKGPRGRDLCSAGGGRRRRNKTIGDKFEFWSGKKRTFFLFDPASNPNKSSPVPLVQDDHHLFHHLFRVYEGWPFTREEEEGARTGLLFALSPWLSIASVSAHLYLSRTAMRRYDPDGHPDPDGFLYARLDTCSADFHVLFSCWVTLALVFERYLLLEDTPGWRGRTRSPSSSFLLVSLRSPHLWRLFSNKLLTPSSSNLFSLSLSLSLYLVTLDIITNGHKITMGQENQNRNSSDSSEWGGKTH